MSLKKGKDVSAEDVIAGMGVGSEGAAAEFTGLTPSKPSGTDEADPEKQARRDALANGTAIPEAPAEGDEAAPDPLMERITAAIEALSKKTESTATEQALLLLTGVMERLLTAQQTNQSLMLEEQRRQTRPENKVIPGISVFNRRGRDPQQGTTPKEIHLGTLKKPLKCPMMVPWIAEWESLTREEVDLLNLLEPGSFIVSRIDRTKITVSVQMRYKEDGHTPAMLLLTHETSFNNDNFKLMPPLSDMLRYILKQSDRVTAQKAAAVLSDEEEEALIEAGDLLVTQ